MDDEASDGVRDSTGRPRYHFFYKARAAQSTVLISTLGASHGFTKETKAYHALAPKPVGDKRDRALQRRVSKSEGVVGEGVFSTRLYLRPATSRLQNLRTVFGAGLVSA